MLFGFGKMNKVDMLNVILINSRLDIENRTEDLESHRELFDMVYSVTNKEALEEFGKDSFSYMGKRALALLEIKKIESELTAALESYEVTKEKVAKELIHDLENNQVENCE